MSRSKHRPVVSAAAVTVIACCLVALAGCHDDMKDDAKKDSAKSMASTRSLYDRLGGEPALTAVVDDFVNRAAADLKVNFTRKGTAMEWQATPENVAKLKKRLVQFIAMATGGPKNYEGRSMKAAHQGMKITEAEFNALAADLVASLKKFNVPQREQDELVAIVASTKGDIVEVKAYSPY